MPDFLAPTFKTTPNVIIFGETGAGKSSIINMLEGEGGRNNTAAVSDKATGVTFSSTRFEKKIGGTAFGIFDTAGLNEGLLGTVTPTEAIGGLYQLIRELDDGVNLLVYVMRAPRFKATTQSNYQMFHDLFCRKQVPIVIIVTGLEDREPMDGWWDENHQVFQRYRMDFNGYACITASKGKFKNGRYLYEDEYNESKKTVEQLIIEKCSPNPWSMPPMKWIDHVVATLHNIIAPIFGLDPVATARDLQNALRSYAGLSNGDAVKQANQLARVDRTNEKPNSGIPNS